MSDWAHSPLHRFREGGTYMLTAGTYGKRPYFRGAERLRYLCEKLQAVAGEHKWQLEAWAVFPNHYHFVGISPAPVRTGVEGNDFSKEAVDPAFGKQALVEFLKHLHSVTAIQANRWDQTPGRQTWYQYWDPELTFQKAYLARLSYVHRNAAHHGLVREPSLYPWCSAGWFQQTATAAFFNTVMKMKVDRVHALDEFTVDMAEI
jgi:putative transposase